MIKFTNGVALVKFFGCRTIYNLKLDHVGKLRKKLKSSVVTFTADFH